MGVHHQEATDPREGAPADHASPGPGHGPFRRVLRAVGKRVIVLVAAVLILRFSGCMEGLFYHPGHGPTPPPRGVEGVWFRSPDGTRLFGWWIPAEGRSPADPPATTVIHVHGNAGTIVDHAWFSEHLPPAGFNVFLFDYRGYGQSEGRSRTRGPLIDDTAAAVDAVLARADVDPSRVALYGHSLGGAIALNVMKDRPEIAAAVLESPFVGWRDAAASALGGDPPGWPARGVAWLFIRDSHRADEAIATVRRPILILHGTADSIVPASHAKRLAEASGGFAELVLLEGGEHNSLKDSHPQAAGLMIDFLRKQVPGDSTP